MPLRIQCPEGHTLVVSQAREGATLRCPRCDARVVVPPPAPLRAESRLDVTTSAVTRKPEAPAAIAATVDDPEPPPVVMPPVEVEPPPVWSPPPKSRAIVEPAPPASAAEPEPKIEKEPLPSIEPLPQPVATSTAPTETPAVPIGPATESPAPVSMASPADAPPAAASPPSEELPAPAPETPPPPASLQAVPPLVPSAGQRLAAYVLAASLAAAALFGMGPAVWDVVQALQVAGGSFVARWALGLMVLGMVQMAYAAYLAQLPDWTSGWVVTLFALAAAALYAAMLGVTLMAGDESGLVRGLELGGILASGRVSLWCLCMTSIMATLAFFAGRMSLRWRQAELRA